jgi:uncharacterized protein
MSNRLPEFIDPLHLVKQHRVLKGVVSLSRMRRLTSLMTASGGTETGNAAIEIQFGRDEVGLDIARGTIKAVVQLQCQRCLEPMAFNVETEFTLGVVSSLSEAGNLPENYEPLIVEEPTVSLAELIEDEILLALPAVAMHPHGQCAMTPWEQTQAGGTQKRKIKHKQNNMDEADSMYNGAPGGPANEVDDGRQHPFAILEQLKGKITK